MSGRPTLPIGPRDASTEAVRSYKRVRALSEKTIICFQEDLTSTQILYRTMVLAGAATLEDREVTREILTTPRVIELGQIHDTVDHVKLCETQVKKMWIPRARSV